jgi:hypothetical protein
VVVTINGCSSASSEAVDIIVGIDEISNADMSFSIRPNPFTTEATIHYTIPFEGQVNLTITSIPGSGGQTIINERQVPGDHQAAFDTGKLLPGIYIATLRVRSRSDEQVSIIKIVKAQ